MAKLKPGAMMVDLVGGGCYGDVEHCDIADLLESAEALLSLVPLVEHKGLWGIAKAFDADTYIYTTNKSFQPAEGIILEADIYYGYGSAKRFNLVVMVGGSDRETYFRYSYYEILFAQVRGDRIDPDTTGLEDMTKPWRDKMARERAEAERRKPAKQLTLF